MGSADRHPVATRVWSAARFSYRNETLLLVALLATTALFQLRWNAVTLGIYGLGIVSGSALALQALGLILVYRSNRVINFAQFSIGATAASMFSVSVQDAPMLRMARGICQPCVAQITSTDRTINYWVSLVLALVVSMGLSWLVYRLVVRRFAAAPRLILTVATIFVAEALPALGAGFADLAANHGPSQSKAAAPGQAVASLTQAVKPPFDFSFTVRQGGVPVVFHAASILTVVAAALAAAGLAVYLRRPTGMAIRAAAENPARAATLGIDIGRVTSRVWLLVGLLSGVGGLLQANSTGITTGIDTTILVEILLIAVMARMTSLPFAAVSAVVVGVFSEATEWAFGSSVPLSGALFVLVAIALFVQRDRISRGELEQASSWQATREARPVPAVLAKLPTVRKWRWAGGGLLACILVGYPWLVTPTQVQLGSLAVVYGVLGLSLLILTGWAGQISLGQFGLAATGAYVAAVSHAPFPVAVLLGAVAGTLAAAVVGLPALRLRGLQLAVISLAFSLAVSTVLLDPSYLGRWMPNQIGDASLFGLRMAGGPSFYFLALAVLGLATAAVVGLRRTRTGRALIAARDNERSAQSLGIGLTRLRLSAFAVSGCLAGMAGALLAYQTHSVDPQNFAPGLSISIFLFMVIGGMGSVAGPLVGTAYAWIVFIGNANPVILETLTGFGGLALLLFFPGGLARVWFDLRDSALRRIASRQRLTVPSLVADRDASRDDDRAGIAPKVAKRGGALFVPRRYRLDGQWITGVPDSIVRPGQVGASRSGAPVRRRDSFRGLRDDTDAVGAGHV